MTKRILTPILLALLCVACAKQQPEQPPGTALITNFKTSLTVAQFTLTGAKAALPAFACTPTSKPDSHCLDADDQKVANGIIDDIGTTRDSVSTRLGPYDHFDSKNGDEVKQAARDGLATLQDLHDKRIDHVKNPNARAQVDAAFGAIKGLLDMILNTTPPPAPA